VTSCAQRLAIVVTVLVPMLAPAHDFWLERAGEGLALHRGHRGGKLLPIEQARLKAVRCVAKGATRDLLGAATFTPKVVELAGRCDAAGAFFDGGYWSLTPDGEVNQPRNLVPRAVKAWASRQFAKWVDARSPGASGTVFGDELELVAVGDISRARAGDEVTVRVLSAGKPVANAIVAIDHEPFGASDGAGAVRVKLRTSGVETIGATLRRKVATPEADSVVLEASLTFEVAR